MDLDKLVYSKRMRCGLELPDQDLYMGGNILELLPVRDDRGSLFAWNDVASD